MRIVTGSRIGEVNLAVGVDIQIVRVAQAGIIHDRKIGSISFSGQPFHFSVRRDRIQPHGSDANLERLILVEGEPQRESSDMDKDFPLLVVRRKKPYDISMSRPAIQMVVAIQDDIFRPFYFTGSNQFRFGQLGIQGVSCPAIWQH